MPGAVFSGAREPRGVNRVARPIPTRVLVLGPGHIHTLPGAGVQKGSVTRFSGITQHSTLQKLLGILEGLAFQDPVWPLSFLKAETWEREHGNSFVRTNSVLRTRLFQVLWGSVGKLRKMLWPPTAAPLRTQEVFRILPEGLDLFCVASLRWTWRFFISLSVTLK